MAKNQRGGKVAIARSPTCSKAENSTGLENAKSADACIHTSASLKLVCSDECAKTKNKQGAPKEFRRFRQRQQKAEAEAKKQRKKAEQKSVYLKLKNYWLNRKSFDVFPVAHPTSTRQQKG